MEHIKKLTTIVNILCQRITHEKSLLPMLISAAVDGIWGGLDSITHLQRRNVRLKQPHWKSTQSDVEKSDTIAKAEAKRARKKPKKDNAGVSNKNTTAPPLVDLLQAKQIVKEIEQ